MFRCLAFSIGWYIFYGNYLGGARFARMKMNHLSSCFASEASKKCQFKIV
jgi:hypothetical protein